jgi:hypothetical protein
MKAVFLPKHSVLLAEYPAKEGLIIGPNSIIKIQNKRSVIIWTFSNITSNRIINLIPQ